MPTVAQTPGTWLKGGAGGNWSAECKAALVACGINPDAFGTYDMRADVQGKVRGKYRKKRDEDAKKKGSAKKGHEPNCGSRNGKLCTCIESENALKDMGAEEWTVGMSQSGHISQNAFYQGKREDPCSNVPGEPGAHGGGYGYQDNMAFCMDHVGRSSDPGSDHYEITQRERRFKDSLKKKGITVVTMADIERGARGTLEIAVKGGEVRINGAATPEDADRGKITAKRKSKAALIAKGREEHVKDLKKKNNSGKQAGKSGKAKKGKRNAPSTKAAKKKAEQKAVDCIIDAWKQSLDEMRSDLIDQHSDVAASSQACKDEIRKHNKSLPKGAPKAKSYQDLPRERKDAVNRSDEVKKARAKRMKDLEKDGATKGTTGKNNKKPSEEQCLEYQAHWLANHRASDGGLLPMQGRLPGKSKKASAPRTKKKKPGKSSV